MALIECPDCKTQISDKKGTICPSCGLKVKKKKKKNKDDEYPGSGVGLQLVVALVLVIVTLLTTFLTEGGDSRSEVEMYFRIASSVVLFPLWYWSFTSYFGRYWIVAFWLLNLMI